MLAYVGVMVAALAAVACAQSDPCVPLAGKTFVRATDALACQQSFPFNETLRSNVLSVVSK